jgi:putative hemolysin
MINIEQAVLDKFPGFAAQPKMLREPTVSFLKKMLHQDEVNDFVLRHEHLKSFEFIDAVFDYFNFSYSVSARERANIPAEGRLVVVANHPIGSLDGLAILKMMGEVRSDVKIIANDLLMNFTALHPLFIPVDNMGSGSARKSIKATLAVLEQEQAVIIFPAGEVSRARPTGIKDGRWRPGFLHFVRKTNAPVLPVHIGAKNSLLFYSASMLFKPLGTALLAREMFNKRSSVLHFRVGEAIAAKSLQTPLLRDRALVRRLKKHVYSLAKHRNFAKFETLRTVAHPEDRQQLQTELAGAQLLGETRDGQRIYLFDAFSNSAVMREIGRLREITFRRVGEGTGNKRDLDDFDRYYRHLVLWNRDQLEIVGAYRLGEGRHILSALGEKGFYTRSLYRFEPQLRECLAQGIELGRSFVSPRYWGKASLDYLWQGLGAYLAHHSHVRYLFGPVSMSAEYPRELMDTLVFFYQRFHSAPSLLAQAVHPYSLSSAAEAALNQRFADCDRDQAFELMQELFKARGFKIPVLFKQYSALFEEGGFQTLAFGIDPDFSDCLDGLCMADLGLLKTSRRERYIKK